MIYLRRSFRSSFPWSSFINLPTSSLWCPSSHSCYSRRIARPGWTIVPCIHYADLLRPRRHVGVSMSLRDALGARLWGKPCIPLPAGETGFFISFLSPCVKLTLCVLWSQCFWWFSVPHCHWMHPSVFAKWRVLNSLFLNARILLLVQSVSKSGRG
jgi:hypothetical protein